jgi:hypothetical protein
MRGCSLLTDDALRALARSACWLGNSVTGERGTLESLHLARCSQLTDSGFAAMFEQPAAAAATRPVEAAPGAVARTATLEVGLRVLDVGHCRQLSNRTVSAAARCCGRTLQHLDVRGLATLSDAAVADVGQYCAVLLTISAQRCTKLSDASIIALAEGCSVLGLINVMGCRNINSHWAFRYVREQTLNCNIRFVDAST